VASWNERPWGKYYQVRGGELVSANGNKSRRVEMDQAVDVTDAYEGFIDPEQFDRVQRKVRSQKRRHPAGKNEKYPLTGLMVCKHCGKPMQGHGRKALGKQRTYVYQEYCCWTYLKYGRGGVNTTCGSQQVDAPRVLAWLIHKLQDTFLGPARGKLVQSIKAELKAQGKGTGVDVGRLQKRVQDLDVEVSRLVKAIRTIDAAELVEELGIVRSERDRAQAELDRAGASVARNLDGDALDAEAARIADTLGDLAANLDDADPAVLREVLRQFVSRIICEWQPYQTKTGKTWHRFIKGVVELRPVVGYDCLEGCEERLDDALTH
jgi:hypothetical protein